MTTTQPFALTSAHIQGAVFGTGTYTLKEVASLIKGALLVTDGQLVLRHHDFATFSIRVTHEHYVPSLDVTRVYGFDLSKPDHGGQWYQLGPGNYITEEAL